MSYSWQPHELQHSSPPCPSPTPESSLRLMSIESVMPSSHLILCGPLLLLSPIPPSIRVFSNESTLHMRWPKYWSFSFNISRSSEHPRLISLRMDWLDLLSVQGTIKSLLQQQSSKASILLHSALFIVQLSHPYMTTGKNIDLTRWTFVDKVMSLLFNMLSSIVPSKEITGLISFRMDWLDLLAVQGILNIFFFFFCYYFAIFYLIFFKLFLMIPWIMSEHILVTTRELKSFYQRDEKQGKI